MKEGGRYIVKKAGAKPERVEFTRPHPEGNAPRDEKGNRLDIEQPPVPVKDEKPDKSTKE